MKKLLAVVIATIALAGCNDSKKIYDCGKDKFEVNSDYMKVLTNDENYGFIIHSIGGGMYRLLTIHADAYYEVDDNKITVRVGAFKNVLTCEVK